MFGLTDSAKFLLTNESYLPYISYVGLLRFGGGGEINVFQQNISLKYNYKAINNHLKVRK